MDDLDAGMDLNVVEEEEEEVVVDIWRVGVSNVVEMKVAVVVVVVGPVV